MIIVYKYDYGYDNLLTLPAFVILIAIELNSGYHDYCKETFVDVVEETCRKINNRMIC